MYFCEYYKILKLFLWLQIYIQQANFKNYHLAIKDCELLRLENFCAIQAVETSTISCDVDTIGGDTSITSLALGAGVVIYGNFDDVAVASGKVVCYLR